MERRGRGSYRCGDVSKEADIEGELKEEDRAVSAWSPAEFSD
jgi:hypothetical protein